MNHESGDAGIYVPEPRVWLSTAIRSEWFGDVLHRLSQNERIRSHACRSRRRGLGAGSVFRFSERGRLASRAKTCRRIGDYAQYGMYRRVRGPASGSWSLMRLLETASRMIRLTTAEFLVSIPKRCRNVAFVIGSRLTYFSTQC